MEFCEAMGDEFSVEMVFGGSMEDGISVEAVDGFGESGGRAEVDWVMVDGGLSKGGTGAADPSSNT